MLPTMTDEFYYNVVTGQVEEGNQSSSRDLMGPYDSASEAAAAYEIARKKTEAWDQQDHEWKERG